MKKRIAGLSALCLLCTLSLQAQTPLSVVVPVGGNSWVSPEEKNGEKPDAGGWKNWTHASAVWSTYAKLFKKGTCRVSALLNVPSGTSRLRFTLNGQSKEIEASGAADKMYVAGTWEIDQPGYIKIDAQGVSKTGNVFANLQSFLLEGTAVDSNTACVRNNEDNLFYFGRRGPSVHINYDLAGAADGEVEWFYNEITVPQGNDVPGSYFMADGFAEGYFGMQVNSATERRIIFSVWSPFATDNPKEVPDDKKIILVKKGLGVVTNEFGNEGSGGHSHLVYNWKAGETQRFLLQGRPVENNYTNYTAFFFDNRSRQWVLIASFNRPATHTYLKRLHSFLENFEPQTGNHSRKAYYHNQWIKPAGGDWAPVTTMYLTADATAKKRYRLDYMGGAEAGKFYLKNCGFFNETAELGKPFVVAPSSGKPAINLSQLDNELLKK